MKPRKKAITAVQLLSGFCAAASLVESKLESNELFVAVGFLIARRDETRKWFIQHLLDKKSVR